MSPNVLFIDDEPSVRQATATLLRSRGYAVTLASTGAEGLSAFERQKPTFTKVVQFGSRFHTTQGNCVRSSTRDRNSPRWSRSPGGR